MWKSFRAPVHPKPTHLSSTAAYSNGWKRKPLPLSPAQDPAVTGGRKEAV